MKIKETLLSLLYPRHCPVCHEIVMPKGAMICPDCQKKVSFVEEPTCLRCGKEIASPEIEYCYDCSHHTRSFQQGVALAIYDPVMRRSVAKFKNQGRMEYADWYAEALWQRYGALLNTWKIQAVVPVPLHPSRYRKRGYNQAELLAKRLGRHLNVPVLSKALIRTRKTVAQKYLGGRERQRNLESVFAAGPQTTGTVWGIGSGRFGKKRVAGKIILLVDDIYTTGSTAQACTEVLLAAGATEVYLASVCIGENEGA